MNTVIRTSIHQCFVTAEALEFFNHDPDMHSLDVMKLPPVEQLVSSRVLVPPHAIEGGHVHAVVELTERVDAK